MQATDPQRGTDFEPEGTKGVPAISARLTLRFLDADTNEMVLALGSGETEPKACQTMTLTRVS